MDNEWPTLAAWSQVIDEIVIHDSAPAFRSSGTVRSRGGLFTTSTASSSWTI
jgi:hypothetical protein